MILKFLMLVQAALGAVGFPTPTLEAALDLVGSATVALPRSIIRKISRVLIGVVLRAASAYSLTL